MNHSKEADYMLTISGKMVSVTEPKPETINIHDIAVGLSSAYSFGGHLTSKITVAEHSLMVCRRLAEKDTELQLAALLHDASEAYMGDLKTPYKRHCPDFEYLEDLLMDAIYLRFDIRINHNHSLIKLADDLQFRWESTYLYRDVPLVMTRCMSPDRAYAAFIEKFNELTNPLRQLG